MAIAGLVGQVIEGIPAWGVVVIALAVLCMLALLYHVRSRLVSVWEAVRTSFWFVPGLMVIGAIGLSAGLIGLEGKINPEAARNIRWLWTGGPEAGRGILSTIATSMVTIAGVVFSITMVVLALVSNQFGPRLMRNFREDKGNQLVLGTFTATFVYCLLVLRKVVNGPGPEFVPYISIAVAIILALVNIAVLIYFIHHVAVMTQAPYVVSLVSDDLSRAINQLFPEELGQELGEPGQDPPEVDLNAFDAEAGRIVAPSSGYLLAVDADALMDIVASEDIVVHLRYRPGDFVFENSILATAQPKDRVNQTLAARVHRVFILGRQRSPLQDVEFGVRQLVEIAVRALSPGINDPFTAMTCADHLGVALRRIASRKIPSSYRYDASKKLRVIADAVTFKRITEEAFNPIRQYGRSSPTVSLRLLETLTVIAKSLVRRADRLALQRQAFAIRQHKHGYLHIDQQAIERQYQDFLAALGRDGSAVDQTKISAGARI